MKIVTVMFAIVFALSAASLYGQGRGQGQAKKTTTQSPKATAQQTRKADTRVAKTEKRVAKAETRAAKNTAKTNTRTTTTTTTTTATTTTDAPMTKAQARAARLNPQQEQRLLTRLPAGMTVQDAAAGFRNWGQFQAAVNASTNHTISFVELKSKMTGIPVGGTERTMTPMSLGQALQSFGITETTPTPTTTATTTPTTTTTTPTP